MAAQIPEGPGAFSVSTGHRHTCAVVTGGAIRCWGYNQQGQLGYGHQQSIGDDEFPYLSGDVELGEPAIQVVSGAGHTCALLATGAVRCWGDAGAGKLGNGDYERAKWIAEELEGRTVHVGDDETARHALRVELGAPALQLAAGGQFTCALLATGMVRCWGRNGDGSLGVPSYTGNIGDQVLPACVPAVDLGGPATFIASGQSHTCAILRGGSVRCFGDGVYGRLGYGNTADVGKDDVPAAAGDVELGGVAVSLSAGAYHTCAVLDSGLLRCWGHGSSLQLGFDEFFHLGDVRTPAAEPALDLGRGVRQVAAGHSHTCALLDNGLVRCWGSNDAGQLGAPGSGGNTPLSRAAPSIQLGGLAIQIASRNDHTCAVLDNRELVCWGDNSAGALGYGNSAHVTETSVPADNGFVPVLVPPPPILPPIADPPEPDAGPAVSAPPDAGAPDAAPTEPLPELNVADAAPPEPAQPVCETGAARCELSVLSVCNSERTAFEPRGDCATSRVCARARPSCDLASCIPEELGCLIPVARETSRIQSFSTGERHACALLAGGALRCWGLNRHGQLGYGHTNNIGDDELAAAAGTVPLGEPALSVVAGGRQTCAILQGGRVRCWGDGGRGRLGRGDTVSIGDTEFPDASTGTLRLGGSAIQLSAGSSFTCALLENGDVRCWGVGTDGKLGVPGSGDIGDDEAPADVAPVALGGPALAIASGQNHTCAILDNDDRDVRCWGANGSGQLGYAHRDDIGDVLTPASQPPVELAGRALQLSLGTLHSCALLEGGEVRCWGFNRHNQLGYTPEAPGSLGQPLTQPALSFGQPALQIVAAEFHTCALLFDRSVRCWGAADSNGLLGAGRVSSEYVPLSAAAPRVDLGGESLRIDAGDLYSCALLGTDELICWGNGADGQLGHGRSANSPGSRIGDDETPAAVGPVPLF